MRPNHPAGRPPSDLSARTSNATQAALSDLKRSRPRACSVAVDLASARSEVLAYFNPMPGPIYDAAMGRDVEIQPHEAAEVPWVNEAIRGMIPYDANNIVRSVYQALPRLLVIDCTGSEPVAAPNPFALPAIIPSTPPASTYIPPALTPTQAIARAVTAATREFFEANPGLCERISRLPSSARENAVGQARAEWIRTRWSEQMQQVRLSGAWPTQAPQGSPWYVELMRSMNRDGRAASSAIRDVLTGVYRAALAQCARPASPNVSANTAERIGANALASAAVSVVDMVALSVCGSIATPRFRDAAVQNAMAMWRRTWTPEMVSLNNGRSVTVTNAQPAWFATMVRESPSTNVAIASMRYVVEQMPSRIIEGCQRRLNDRE